MVYDLYATPALSGQHGIGYTTADLACDLGLSPASDRALAAAEDAELHRRRRSLLGRSQPHRPRPRHPGPRDRFQRGDRVALVHTGDPHTRLRPGDEGTVTRYDPLDRQFSDCSAPFDASELRFYVADMPVTLSSRRGGEADMPHGSSRSSGASSVCNGDLRRLLRKVILRPAWSVRRAYSTRP